MSAILECKELVRTFHGRNGESRILDGLNLAVDKGQFVVVTGRSGTGKSTLLYLLGGLDVPTSGTVFFDGRAITGLSTREMTRLRRGRIGTIFQDFNLISSWTALENVEAPLLPQGLAPSERTERAVVLLSRFGLASRTMNLPSELSIGEQQRVAVARTLITSPELILADEPTGSVDPMTGEEILTALIEHVQESQATLVLTTHGNFSPSMADIVYHLEKGKLHQEGR